MKTWGEIEDHKKIFLFFDLFQSEYILNGASHDYQTICENSESKKVTHRKAAGRTLKKLLLTLFEARGSAIQILLRKILIKYQS